MDHTQQHNVGYDSTQQQQQQQQQQPKPSLPNSNTSRNVRKPKPYVKIIEQPAGKALRFRYECEGRSAGSIPGVNSTSENKTYPTIEIVGYKGRAVVVVSCVTKDEPYRPHPHNLVGKEGCKKGVCTIEINSETMRTVFSNLGIQCVKKKDIEAALKAREEIRVDPFKTGFQHRFQPSGIDLNSVRLCFQVFMEGEQKGRFTQPLPPVVSEPIYDKKAMSDLVICRLCSCSASVLGNNQIILLCEKVAKEDISIRFFEEKDDQVIWEGYGDFQHTDVHKQTAITFKTPRYHKLDITEPAKVFIQLKRPSDGVTSEALPFQYIPLDSGRHRFWDLRRNLKRKPDLDIFQQILNVDREIQQSAVTSSEIIDLNTPTGEEEKNLQNNLSDIETTLTLTNDPKHAVTEDRNSLEIDSIIEEKIRELEQQQIKTETSINPSREFSTNITQDEAKAAFEMNTSATGEMPPFTITDKINEWMKSNENNQKETNGPLPTDNNEEDKTLDEILEQVAELDEIYSDRVTRRDTYNNALLNELNDMDTCIATEASRNLVDGSQTAMEVDENFDDAATYTSLQIAFKNPITIPMDDLIPETMTEVAQHYDPVEVRNSPVTDSIRIQNAQPLQGPPRPPAPTKFTSPFMHVTAAEEEKVPPLPPKRLRKQDSNAENRSIEANIGDTSNRPQRQAPPSIIIMKTPDQSPPTKRLPPKPDANNCNTLPKQKKPGFFSKLFSRRKSKSDLNSAPDQVISKTGSKTNTPADSRESSFANFHLNDPNRSSIRSAKSLQPSSLPTSPLGKTNKVGKPVGRSVSSVSGKRPAHLNADVIHIPLKGDSTNSLPQQEDYSKASTLTLSNTLDRKTVSALQLADIPICEGNMELVAIADRQSLRNLCEGEYNVQLDPDVDLTEAEHFALYTSVPPQATVSEFDETSAYYAAVDGGEILTPEELAERLVAANHPAYLKRKRQKSNGDPIYTLLSQQPKSQHQHDQLEARRGSITSWNQSKKPVIKTEPRDTSPQPFNLYHAQHEVTQSPHSPLSPCCNYNQPSPYGMVSTTTALPIIPQVIGQYKTSPNSAGAPCRPSPNNLHEYNVFNQQTQNTPSNFTGTSQWESKFSPNIINNNDTIGNDATQFRIYNALTAGLSNANANRTDGNCVETVPHANWPLPPANLYAQMHHYQANPVVVPPCNVEQMQTNNNNQNNHNNSEQGLSNLLNFDSTQLVRIDTEDQQMLQLNTEDLQISNLSIST